MHQVELVLADRGWILEKLANSIVSQVEPQELQIAIVDKPTGRADLTYFLPYSVQQDVHGSIVGSYFSHREDVEPAHTAFVEKSLDADFCVCSAQRYRDLLERAGARRVELVHLGADRDVFFPKLRIGVVGRTYHTGRKGESVVADVMDLNFIDWRFVGEGWPGKNERLGSVHEMASFYRGLDFLLVPALIEGGPVPALEAIACGCPIISGDVGCVDELPHIPFETGDSGSLRSVLKDLYQKKVDSTPLSEDFSWDAFGRKHAELFRELLEGRAPRSNSLDDNEMGEIALVIHGSERNTKGGPSVRAQLIQQSLHDSGFASSLTFDGMADDRGVSVAHIFNSWPLKTAQKAASHARNTADVVILSPIALDLRHVEIYSKLIPRVFAAYRESPNELRAKLREIERSTPSLVGKGPCERFEGVPGHFDSLRRMTALAGSVILLSEYERDFLQSIGCDISHHRIVRNGVDVSVMSDADPERFRQYFSLENYVVVVGRIESRKNQAAVAAALQDHDVTLVLLGHVGDPSYFKSIRDLGCDNIVHIDRIEDRDLLASAYAGSLGLILPSWTEGAPLVAMEAAAAGARLLLSEMSSEREYFGEYARYVHPCDIDGIRRTVDEWLSTPSDNGDLQSFAKQNFDIHRHVQETREHYSECWRTLSSNQVEQQTLLDVTHLAHSLHNNKVLTGVNSLELEIFETLRDTYKRSVVWNSPNRQFVVSSGPLEPDLRILSNARVIQSENENDGHFLLQVPDGNPIERQYESNGDPRDARWNPSRVAKTVGKMTLAKLPDGIRVKTTSMVRKVRPDFEPIIEDAHLLNGTSPQGRPLHQPASERSEVGEDNSVLGSLHFKRVHQQESPSVGSRIIVLGQPWISNDRYCTDLIAYCDEFQIQLELVIPDILYVTSALSFDMATRVTYERRMASLLSICTRVYTISREAQSDLEQFCASSGYDIDVVCLEMGVPRLPESASRVKGLQSSAFVLYVGSINQRKNHDFLVQVWREARRRSKSLKDIKLVFAGSPQKGYEHYDSGELGNRLRDENILLVKGASDEQIRWMYENCLFTVYPSISEGWGFPIQESLVYGKVCLASDGAPAALATECAGVVRLDPNTFQDWVSNLIAMASNNGLRERLESHATHWSPQSWADNIRFFQQAD